MKRFKVVYMLQDGTNYCESFNEKIEAQTRAIRARIDGAVSVIVIDNMTGRRLTGWWE